MSAWTIIYGWIEIPRKPSEESVEDAARRALSLVPVGDENMDALDDPLGNHPCWNLRVSRSRDVFARVELDRIALRGFERHYERPGQPRMQGEKSVARWIESLTGIKAATFGICVDYCDGSEPDRFATAARKGVE